MYEDFYSKTIRDLLSRGLLSTDMKILIICAGELDKNTFLDLGFSDVTISNLDERMDERLYLPYKWSFQNAENLTYDDNEFDYTIVHAGLHHCRSPHRAMLEMYRVSKNGIIVFETRDNLLIKISKKFNLVEDYEISAVACNDYKYGGVKNTQIPNYVYRWTENEVRKTIKSFAPEGRHKFIFYYGLQLPYDRIKLSKNKFKIFLAKAIFPIIKLLSIIFRKQCNQFCFFIIKPKYPNDLYPWLELRDDKISINKDFISNK